MFLKRETIILKENQRVRNDVISNVLRFLVTANVVPNSLILFTLLMEEIRSSETSVLTKRAPRQNPEDAILHGHLRENLRSYTVTLKGLAYTSLVRPILEYAVSFWDPSREGQVNTSDRVQNKVVQFAHHNNHVNKETLAQRRKIVRIWTPFKAYTGERAWKAKRDKLQKPRYLSRVERDRNN
jgi:hypothetical protein